MKITIVPRRLEGEITPPPSKSYAHRYVLAAALAQGKSVIKNIDLSQDVEATLQAVSAFGAGFKYENRQVTIENSGFVKNEPEVDCAESGSTLRFLIPVMLAVCGGARFSGRGRLMQRPLEPYKELFPQKGILWEAGEQLNVSGVLKGGTYPIRGDISSQFITGLLYALPLLGEDSTAVLTTPLESRPYVDMTLDVLDQAGVQIENRDYGEFFIPGNQKYRSRAYAVESDYSQAAFYYVANALDSRIQIGGMNFDSVQGDREILNIIKKLEQPGFVPLDMGEVPDLVPIVSVLAALRSGKETKIFNAARLRLKESDRLDAMTQELSKLGADISQRADGLEIMGVDFLSGGEVDAHNDHRIAMALAIGATRAAAPVIISGAESVNKSYPDFWKDYQMLGGDLA